MNFAIFAAGMKRFFVIAATFLCFSIPALAQKNSWQERIYMEYYVEAPGDTVYVDELAPAIVFPRIKNKKDPDVKKYYKLVYNFSKVYPYTSVAKKVIAQAEQEMAGMNRFKKDKYVQKVESKLLKDFSDIARNMTISQGKLLIRLVDRETGMTPYKIVKDYKSGLAASFWQGVGKLFGQNLKTPYDPKGEDRMTEYLIEKWEHGQFDALYFSLFAEWPEKIDIPHEYE